MKECDIGIWSRCYWSVKVAVKVVSSGSSHYGMFVGIKKNLIKGLECKIREPQVVGRCIAKQISHVANARPGCCW